jgi:uncharacterized membrane protein
MITTPQVISILTGLTTALMAGLFYSYSCSVNPGLAKLSDAEYLTAMQSINRAILNPAFYIAFFGAVVLLPLNTYLNSDLYSNRFWLSLSASVVYILGLTGVTIFGNVPLNEMLDKFVILDASVEEIKEMRKTFELSWNRFHLIRTIAVIVSLILFLFSIIIMKPIRS